MEQLNAKFEVYIKELQSVSSFHILAAIIPTKMTIFLLAQNSVRDEYTI